MPNDTTSELAGLSSLYPFIAERQADFGFGSNLFDKVPRPGDSEVTFAVFESSCYLLLPV